ncbi:type II toxin-antitoxin system PemK/MazF family toxin [Candidatus Saccharibacteria bacterium]|nr:type II toxin-antitoxin system PemK/MazF family toxin [Candidatus Saccharibacteria bacterium]
MLKNDFAEWMDIKDKIQKGAVVTKFSEGQIWWAALGKNIGVEINGKHEDYSRPVVIFKKMSHLCFWAIPLTSQPHSGTWYTEFDFRGKREYVVLSQMRMMSVSRLYNRMGKLSTGDFKKIKVGFKKLLK